MDKLKNSIQEANQAVDKEREKNVSLLHLIFPPDIAERLWLGALFFLVVLPLTSLPPPPHPQWTHLLRPHQIYFNAGESIDAKAHDNVTMLFSDIVGFTSICSTTTPFMVIKMLEDLYSQFDEFCGILDVYKV